MAAIALREGLEAWRGDNCCSPMAAAFTNGNDVDGCGCGPGCTDACCSPAGDTTRR